MTEYETDIKSNINFEFNFKKKPATFFSKLVKNVNKLASPLLFAGGFITAYMLYNHANFFHLTTFFYWLRLVSAIGVGSIGAMTIAQSLLIFREISEPDYEKKLNGKNSLQLLIAGGMLLVSATILTP